MLKLKSFARQLLFAFNILIAFLLVFENYLVIPAWLQTVGRMHPLMLHFPIVILMMAMLMEFFRFKTQNAENIFYRNYLENLLLIGALLTAVTVLMGLFLSREDGYSGDTLLWHKWTGAALFYLASLIYWVREEPWYKNLTARAVAVVAVICLVLTGHYGAALTHGEGFIFEPVFLQREMVLVPAEKAVVFNDVVLPVFKQKCESCHNPSKLKGELALTDAISVQKGGKSGKLFVPGHPENSILIQRIGLSGDDKKHMPPLGKAQLTSEEIMLLSLWVKEKADFKKKVTEFPATDSLRIMASHYLKPASKTDDIFDFPAVDEKTIQKLNNDYRTVSEVARESPALSVNIYNRAAFDAKQLDDLGNIREQIISLNLNKMPLKDQDLNKVSQFQNLRKLDLNFTDVTAKGLKALTGFKHLENLTLSGTNLNFKDLNAVLADFKALKTISVWDSHLAPAEIGRLQKQNPAVTIIGGFTDDGTQPLKLNPVQVKNTSTVFMATTPLLLRHPIKGVTIRYTTDGTEPDSINSPVFNGKTTLSQSAVIKAKAFKNGWYGSERAIFTFFKSSVKPDSVHLLFPLDRVHQAEGARTFFDGMLGVIGANNPAWANNWAAVKENDMAEVCEFKKPVSISSVGLRYMIEEDTGIFPPEIVEVWGGSDPKNLKLLTRFKAALPSKGDKPSLQSVEGKFKPQTVSYLKIVARPLTKIPAWHRDKDKKALLLVDEMFIN